MSGIYQIRNIVTNDIYVGSAKCFLKRKQIHWSSLKGNYHSNIYLQNAVNKYELKNFSFELLAKCPVEYLAKLEQWFLDNLKHKYNLLTVAYNSTGYKHTNESKRKIALKLSKPVIAILPNKTILGFDVINDAAKYFGIKSVQITRVCQNKRKHCHNIIFKYKK